MVENEITRQIVDAAYRVHRSFGPGLLESVYRTLMMHELEKRGLKCQREVAIPLVSDGIRLDAGFRADMIVENRVIVEIKSIEALAPVHRMQLLAYLRLADKRLGLLLNFNVALIRDGIWRVVNGMHD
jgi:GxxExxY protein